MQIHISNHLVLVADVPEETSLYSPRAKEAQPTLANARARDCIRRCREFGARSLQPRTQRIAEQGSPTESAETEAYRWLFSVVSNAASIPEPGRSSFGAISHGGKFYLFGGHQGEAHNYPESSFLDRVDIYDPESQQWSQGSPRPAAASRL